MTHHSWDSRVTMAALAAGMWLMPISAGAQYAATPTRDAAGPAVAAAATPRMADGHPDLSGLWMVGVARPLVVDENGNVIMNGSAREGSGANAERDGFLRKRMDPNRPVYKPEFWEKVQYL